MNLSGRNDPIPAPVPTVDDAALVLEQGLKLHQSNRLLEAARHYREALDIDPGHPDGLHLSGILAFQGGGHVEALEFIDRALGQLPRHADAHNSRGNVLRALGRPDDALGAYRQAISLAPANALAWNNLGNALRELGRPEEALRAYREALARSPQLAEARLNLGMVLADLGNLEEALAAFQTALKARPELVSAHVHIGGVLRKLGRLDEALESFRRAVTLDPSHPGAYCQYGAALSEARRYPEAADALQAALALDSDSPEAHNYMGDVCKALGYRDQALSAYRQALAGRPDYSEAHYNLGLLLGELHRPVEAIASFRAALTFRADYHEAQAAMGVALLRLSRSAEAITAFRRALELHAESAAIWHHLGRALQEEGQIPEAIAAYGRALTLLPGFAEAHWHRAQARLIAGDYEAAWDDYEWRWKVPELRLEERDYGVPRWDGSPLAGRTILIHSEQHPGETLHFARFLPLVAERGGRVVLETHSTLIRLLQLMPSLSQVIARGAAVPPVDYELPLQSLPRVLGIRRAAVTRDFPYLSAQVWSGKIPVVPPGEGLRVGLIAGATRHLSERSLSPAQLAPLLQLPGITWYNLQQGGPSQELLQVPEAARLRDLSRQMRDLTDTAVLAAQLDLVISTEGTEAYLMGGLGLPAWVLLPSTPDWHWAGEEDASLWYPTTRVFRQARPGDWNGVVEAVRQALVALTIVGSRPT